MNHEVFVSHIQRVTVQSVEWLHVYVLCMCVLHTHSCTHINSYRCRFNLVAVIVVVFLFISWAQHVYRAPQHTTSYHTIPYHTILRRAVYRWRLVLNSFSKGIFWFGYFIYHLAGHYQIATKMNPKTCIFAFKYLRRRFYVWIDETIFRAWIHFLFCFEF